MRSRKSKHWVGAASASALVLGLLAVAQTANAGIENTRHNLGSGSLGPGATSGIRTALDGSTGMGDVFTLAVKEICVFCHTPHGSSTIFNVAMWNKGTPANTIYSTYGSGTMNSTAPTNLAGHMSLACLSCHDGTQAMDNVVNEPLSGGWNKNNRENGLRIGQAVSINGTTTGTATGWYAGNNDIALADYNMSDTSDGKLITGAGVDFIGTDLSNDHPVGMAYCGGNQLAVGSNAGCNDPAFRGAITGLGDRFEVGTSPAGTSTNMRLYGDTVNSATVECGSCHDPHSDALPTFMRASNVNSAVCLTCHIK